MLNDTAAWSSEGVPDTTPEPPRSTVLLVFEVNEHGHIYLTEKMQEILNACVAHDHGVRYTTQHVLANARSLALSTVMEIIDASRVRAKLEGLDPEVDLMLQGLASDIQLLVTTAPVVRPPLFGPCPTERHSVRRPPL